MFRNVNKMKYLKQFESQLYQELDSNELVFTDFHTTMIDPSDETIDLLNSYIQNLPKTKNSRFRKYKFRDMIILELIPKVDIIPTKKQIDDYNNTDRYVNRYGDPLKYNISGEIVINIMEYNDDWFCVETLIYMMKPGTFPERSKTIYHKYKCDTIEGVYQVLDLYLK